MTASKEAIEFAALIADAASEKLAEDIVSFDVSDIVGICEVFIVASGNNNRQVGAVTQEIIDQMKALGRDPIATEGWDDKRWVLIDYGDVVVHVVDRLFLP